jgi:hypothetical protein
MMLVRHEAKGKMNHMFPVAEKFSTMPSGKEVHSMRVTSSSCIETIAVNRMSLIIPIV